MGKYIKSHSNYVLQTKHQKVSDGVIYERDMTTIGGRDQFAKGQVPIYKTGNFVITINNENNVYKKSSEKDWHRSSVGEIWTADILKYFEKDEKTSDDRKIVIKKDYLDLRDYAYYGSCTEMVKSSINNIIKNYPGELFIPYETMWAKYDTNGNVIGVQYTQEAADYANSHGDGTYEETNVGVKGYYTSSNPYETVYIKYNSKNKVIDAIFGKDPGNGYVLSDVASVTENLSQYMPTSSMDDDVLSKAYEYEKGNKYTYSYKYITDKYGKILEVKSLGIIDNPFFINMHDAVVPPGEDPLKYFAEGGIDNYVGYVIDEETGMWMIDRDHEYSLTIEDIIYDGIGEVAYFDTNFIAIGSNTKDICDFFVDIFATDEERREFEEYLKCIQPGKYIGRFKIGFWKNDYSFRTIPGLERDKDGKPMVLCCDDTYKLDGEGNAKPAPDDLEKEGIDVQSFKVLDKYYTLTVYMFMGDDGKIKYLVEDFGANSESYYEKGEHDKGDDDCTTSTGTLHIILKDGFLADNFRYRIRPKEEIVDNYFNNLDSFERILLDRESEPVYTAKFELYNDNDYGYYTYTDQFTFPTRYGGYNLGSTGTSFSDYVRKLSKIGEYYDEHFSDNLWRSLTHESIKNFDWTYTRHYNPGDEEPFIEGGTKTQKIIRLYGREFDNIKEYIDAIDDVNTVTYSDESNIPDYFYTDKLENDGWDIKLVHPLILSEFVNDHDAVPIDINNMFPNKYDADGNKIATADAEKLNFFYDSDNVEERNKIKIQRVFNQDFSTITVRPYSRANITTIRETKWSETHPGENAEVLEFDIKDYGDCVVAGESATLKTSSKSGEDMKNGYHNDCGQLIKLYSSEREFTSSDVNNYFMKMLLLNSREILRHKGTIEGMEMLLSLFGLRSKNRVYTDERYFVNKEDGNIEHNTESLDASLCKADGCDDKTTFNVSLNATSSSCLAFTSTGEKYYKNYSGRTNELYDYDIKEYTMFTTREKDEWAPEKNMYKLDWANSTKLVAYDTADYKNGIYVPYQGLPVAYREAEENDKKVRYLYPYFSDNAIYDGNPYYQMRGGWMQKRPFVFDNKNNIIPENYESDNPKNQSLFTETVRSIKCVQTLSDLLSNPSLADSSGDICQVIDLSGRYAIIDGYPYHIEEEENGFNFIYVTIENNSLSVGNAFFTDYVMISNPYYNNNKQRIDLNDEMYNDIEIKIYIFKDETTGTYDIDCYSNESSISTFTVFENGKYMEGDNYTNYFRINNTNYYNELSVLGWQQLKDDEYEYYRLNTITDYRLGNNPHNGHMNYDNGHEYFEYFQKIFKYSNDNGLVDYRKYTDDDDEYITLMNEFGFKNLIDDDECVYDYDKFLREDNKCHYFGQILTLSDKDENASREGMSCFLKRDSSDLKNYKLTDVYRKALIDDESGTPKLKYLRYGSIYCSNGEDGYYDPSKIDNINHQIVNTKRIEINFYIRNGKEYSKEWIEEVKYIDSVILPYLSQMIPAGVIWRVNYVTRNKVDWDSETVDCNNIGNIVDSNG